MIRFAQRYLADKRNAFSVGLLLLVAAQTINVAHTADLSLHAHGTVCLICQMVGHAPTLPATETAPIAPTLIALPFRDWVATPATPRRTYRPHSPRAPPQSA